MTDKRNTWNDPVPGFDLKGANSTTKKPSKPFWRFVLVSCVINLGVFTAGLGMSAAQNTFDYVLSAAMLLIAVVFLSREVASAYMWHTHQKKIVKMFKDAATQYKRSLELMEKMESDYEEFEKIHKEALK